MTIRYIVGDATSPIGGKTKIIAHVCNDVGGWGKGFVLAISKKWGQPEQEYLNWYRYGVLNQTDTVRYERLVDECDGSDERKFELGKVQFVKASSDIWVANMIAQRDIEPDENGIPPIRYSYLAECLKRVALFARRQNASVSMPRIGCGLAGGRWSEVEAILTDTLLANEVETIVYDLE